MKPERLIAEIARVYETLPRTITGQRRHAGIMPARRACYWGLRHILHMSLTEIGTAMGRHHTTVMHGLQCARLTHAKAAVRAWRGVERSLRPAPAWPAEYGSGAAW